MRPILIISAIVIVILIIAAAIFLLTHGHKTIVNNNGASIAPTSNSTVVAVSGSGARTVMGKTITIHRKSGAGGISLAEVILRGPDGVRLVPKGVTSSSKYSLDGNYDPANLIDAKFSTSARTEYPPAAGEVPTITIDMGADVPIGSIEVLTGNALAIGLAITVTDSAGRKTFGRTITATSPYYAFATAGGPPPKPPNFSSGILESLTLPNKGVVGRYIHATSLPRVFDSNGMRLNAAKVILTKGAAPVYSVDLGSNKGIGRINLAGRGGEHNVVVKSARGDVTYTAAVKKN